jgi:predicted lipid-binding transport protein (Tim44 family)
VSLRRLARRCAPFFILLLLLAAAHAGARPGGGHGFSGGGHSSGGGYSSGGGHSSGGSSYGGGPSYGGGRSSGSSYSSGGSGSSSSDGGGFGCGITLFLLLFISVIALQSFRQKDTSSTTWDSPLPAPSRDLDIIRDLDPDFSAVLFEDFVYALYARAHQARASRKDLDALAPYLSPPARAALAARPPLDVPVSAVVIGALHVRSVHLPAAETSATQVWVSLGIESNLTTGEPGSEQTLYIQETWDLAREATVRTKPPEAVRSFHCPSCGAPFASSVGDRCAFCGEVVSSGRFDWTVMSVRLDASENRPPALTGTVEEQGTSLPTIYQPAEYSPYEKLLRDDPEATDEALAARLRLIYGELNAAWTNLDLRPVRPYVSDNLFDYLQYWIGAYRRQGLRNVLEGMRITRHELVKTVRDRWFDAVTFRIWGTGRDTTVRVSTGELVGGRPNRDREYSEYWTLIRGAGVRGAPRTDKICPNCGAALDVNQAGQCAHCGSHVTRGEFDWVLSRIEQDDSYTG